MARRRRNNEPVVLNIDEIAFIVMATEDNLKYWTALPRMEEAEPHIKVLRESVVNLNALKARRDAGENIEELKRAEIARNGEATMALNRLGPQAIESMLENMFGGSLPIRRR